MPAAGRTKTHRNLSAAVIALAIGATLPVATNSTPGLAPVAAAQECASPTQVLSGNINWGVKQSFLRYLKNPIAMGNWQTSGGATDSGNVFNFPISEGHVDANGKGFARGKGSVDFNGHMGLLKTTISQPTLQFTSPTTAKLLMATSSQNQDGQAIEGLDGLVHFADVTFSSPVTNGGNVRGTTTLTGTGAKAMNDFYKPGTQMDDIELAAEAKPSCEQQADFDESAVNDSANGRVAPQNNAGQSQQSAPAPARAAAPAAPAAAASNSGSSTAEQCTGVNSSQITWGVKESFRSYISGSIAKGGWEGNGVSESGSSFVFSGADGSVDANSQKGSVNTNGSLHFFGHDGKLNLNIANLRATFNGQSGQLIADMESSDVEGNGKNYGTVAIADLSYSNLSATSNSVDGSAQVTLTAAGADAFAGFYEAGTQLDPIAISAQLGGSADCGSAATTASSASAGSAAASKKAADAKKDTAKKDKNASKKFQDKDASDVKIHNADAAQPEIKEAGISGGNFSGWQLTGLAAAFALAAATCLGLNYKRRPQN